ncbi:uncharacterized protein LOC108666881 [Hyalella azteca]|uniref:Uncharacterized protein LOC108666881 n=1 Tax=Hyalella azteca TaxID=294128 RepID=A0A8B7N6R1_HYAAZ|nr:uncharacterized protein LOC108666881 [Hyalella azteca]
MAIQNVVQCSNNDINFGKYFKAVTSTGKIIMQKVSLLVLSSNTNYTAGMSIQSFCCGGLGWSNGELRKIFRSDLPRTKFSLEDPQLEGDVTFWYKIISNLLGPLPDSLKNKLSQLKNLRNCVCHEELTISDLDLIDKMQHLKMLSVDIMKDVDAFLRSDSSAFVDKLLEDLDDLLQQSIMTVISASVECYKEFRDDLIGRLIRNGRRELKKSYDSLKILNPLNWLNDDQFHEFSVKNVFTVLQLSHAGVDIEQSNLLELGNNIRFLARVIILSGVFGSGKTSLCRYLVHEWCSYSNSVHGLNDFDLLIHISLQCVVSDNMKQFITEQLLPLTTKDMKPDEVVLLLQNIRVLFVIDGYDERNAASRALVKEILMKFVDAKIVLASRPEFTLEIKNMVGQHIEVSVLGFDAKRRVEYVDKVMTALEPDKKERRAKSDKFLSMIANNSKRIGEQLDLPLATSLLLILWLKDPESASNISSSTSLYVELFKMFRSKLVNRLLNQSSSHQVQIEKAVDEWYRKVIRIAWKMLISDTLYLSDGDRDELVAAAEALHINPIETLSTFLTCRMQESLSGTSYCFSFMHNSAVEFMAAEYFSAFLSNTENDEVTSHRISLNREQEVLRDLRKSGNILRFREMIIYTFGLLPKSNRQGDEDSIPVPIVEFLLKLLLEELTVSEEETELWHNIITESRYDSAVRCAIGAAINSKSWWTIDETNKLLTNVHLSLMRATFSSPARLNVETNFKSARDIPHLAEFLLLVAIHKNCDVSLNFGRQFNIIDDQEQMDEMVVPLLRANSVIELTGHAGIKAMKALKTATKLRSISLRISSIECLKVFAEYLKQSFKSFHFNQILHLGKKTFLENIEVFLDLQPNSVSPELLPQLIFCVRRSVLKFCGVSDEEIDWCMKCLQKLNNKFSFVVFFQSQITFSGIKRFLRRNSDACKHMKAILVHSSYKPSESENSFLHTHTRPIIRWCKV